LTVSRHNISFPPNRIKTDNSLDGMGKRAGIITGIF